MVVKSSWMDGAAAEHLPRTPAVVVVDPQFDAYGELAASARSGRIELHFRSSGAQAMKLARRLQVDAWLVAPDLDDMSGGDFVALLGGFRGDAKIAMIGGVPGRDAAARTASAEACDLVAEQPITVADLEDLLGLPVSERSRRLAARGIAGSWVALPVSVGAAVVAIAVLMIG